MYPRAHDPLIASDLEIYFRENRITISNREIGLGVGRFDLRREENREDEKRRFILNIRRRNILTRILFNTC